MRSLKSGVQRERFAIGESRETVLNEIAPEAKERFPFYFRLPYKDPIALLRWRINVRRRCVKDEAFRKAVWKMAELDVAFFAVTFATIFEPRPLPRWLPFFLWTDQVSLLAWFTEIYGRRSGAVNKTRGIGLSWLCALFIFHKWLFSREAKIAVLTKDSDLLDGPDCNSLIGKFQYLFDHLPTWAKFTKSGSTKLSRLGGKTTFINTETGSVIQGFVCTSTKLRQLRFTMIFADEFAFWDRTDQEEWMVSSGGCTQCRLMVSTWNSFDDIFHRVMYEEQTSLLRMSAFWWNNHERWQGAYKMESGRVTYVDKAFRHEDGYEFGMPDLIDEGTLRSPWVDAELSEPGINRLKALRDLYGMSVCERSNSFFAPEVRRALNAVLRDPDIQGAFTAEQGVVHIIPTHKSNIKLWANIPKMDRGPYVAFADLGQGVSRDFSVLSIFDKGGVLVLQYGVNTLNITEFAANCVYICRWLAGDNGDGWVLLDFEGGGGQQAKPFAAECVRLGYARIHQSNIQRQNVKQGEISKYYGTKNIDKGGANFRELGRAILDMECIIYSQDVADDMRLVGRDPDNDSPTFPAGRKEGHGDFLQAAAGAWWRARSIVSLENRADLESNKPKSDTMLAGAGLQNGRKFWSESWMQR